MLDLCDNSGKIRVKGKKCVRIVLFLWFGVDVWMKGVMWKGFYGCDGVGKID